MYNSYDLRQLCTRLKSVRSAATSKLDITSMLSSTRPNEDDCCHSGCNPCIFDVYEQQLRKHEKNRANDRVGINCMQLTSYTGFKIIKLTKHTTDTWLYTFLCSEKESGSVIYEPGQHFLLKGRCGDTRFTRAYTPIPMDDAHNSFTVLVKLYENGTMSAYLRNLKVNNETWWRGPYGEYRLEYHHRFMLLIGQGTGIAPLYSVVHEMLHNDECETFVKLFLCCRSQRDLVLRDQLHGLASFWNFTYEVFVSEGEPVQCKYGETVNLFRLEASYLRKYFDKLRIADVRILLCGSDEFTRDVSEKLCELGVGSKQIHRF